MPVLARLSAGFLDGIGLFRTIKKPACGRLLGGGFGLFLVSRTRLQFRHPGPDSQGWGVAAYCCLACGPACSMQGAVLMWRESYWDSMSFPSENSSIFRHKKTSANRGFGVSQACSNAGRGSLSLCRPLPTS